MSLYDIYHSDSFEISVTKNPKRMKMIYMLFYFFLIWSIICSVFLIFVLTSPFRFLIPILMAFFILIFKFVYLKNEEKGNIRLQVRYGTLIYFFGSYPISIPMDMILSIEDKSFYSRYDSNRSGWNHSFIISISEMSKSILSEQSLKILIKDPKTNCLTLIINNLYLDHPDYLKLISDLKKEIE